MDPSQLFAVPIPSSAGVPGQTGQRVFATYGLSILASQATSLPFLGLGIQPQDENGKTYFWSGSAYVVGGGATGGSGFLGVKDIAGTTYPVVETDSGYLLRVLNAAGCTITVPAGLSATHQFGVYVELGAGNATLQGDGTSAMITKGSTLVTNGVKSMVQVLNLGSNVYFATGDLGAIGAADIYAAAVSLLAAGSNITLTPNGSNSISIASTGGSGGSAPPWELGNFEVSVQYPGIATFSTTGANGFATAGTLSAQTGTWNGTNYAQRIRFTSTSAAVNTSCLLSNSQPVGLVPGTSPSDAAIRLSGLFMSGDTNAGCRIGAGWLSVQTPTATVEPSALTNIAMIGADSTDTTLQFMSNDNSGSCTKVDLGASFPKDSSGPYAWALKMEGGAAAARKISYWVYNKATNVLATGSTTTAGDMPVAGSEVHPFTYRNSAAYSATTITLDVAGIWGGMKSGVA